MSMLGQGFERAEALKTNIVGNPLTAVGKY
jgi:hypothetical protein